MKRRNSFAANLFLFLSGLMMVTGCVPAVSALPVQVAAAGQAFDMFVASDIHYLAPALHDDGAAYRRYRDSGDGRQLDEVGEIVDAFVQDVFRDKPEVVILSGDLTNNGERESHVSLAGKLREMEASSGTRVYVIPGNHDIQNPWARRFQVEDQVEVETVTSRQFAEIYGEFGYAEAISRDKSSLSYLAAPSGDSWLLMLDTCIYETNMAAGMPSANGRISDKTLDWIRACAKKAEEAHAKLIAVMHHNLFSHSSLLARGYTLDNHWEVARLFHDLGISLVLSGHVHIQDIRNGPDGNAQMFDIATSSLDVYPMQYGVLHVEPGTALSYRTQRVDVEGWAQAQALTQKSLLHFSENAYRQFSDNSREKAYTRLEKAGGYSEQDMQRMADVMALLNPAYFAGDVASVREEVLSHEGYALWQAAETPEFLSTYIRSMMASGGRDNQHLALPW